MHWIALQPLPEAAADQAVVLADPLAALGWWVLQFTPKVARLGTALLLEVSASERLFRGRSALLHAIFRENRPAEHTRYAQGATSLIALGRLRQFADEPQTAAMADPQAAPSGACCAPATPPDALPLACLDAAREHLATLERMGCNRWGELRALPRGGVARRFGAGLLDALDRAYGLKAEGYPWLLLPEQFDLSLELAAHVDAAPALMFGAHRLLAQLQIWLRSRQRGIVALQLYWEVDQRRSLGASVPAAAVGLGQGAARPATLPCDQVLVRTAVATLDMGHVQRLLTEQLARTSLRAPAARLGLRSLETAALTGATNSLLPDEVRRGDSLHQMLERLDARLGLGQVLRVMPYADHRPEHMQIWAAATAMQQPVAMDCMAARAIPAIPAAGNLDISRPLYPTWLLERPLPLALRDGQPLYQGPLQLLAGPQRLEAAWWAAATGQDDADAARSGAATLRDYFIARSTLCGLLWIYRERAPGLDAAWYLHGLFA